MTRYRNGYIPRDALISIASGTNKDGYWEHQMSPSQHLKHIALVERARKRNNGRTLAITSGWNAYRPIEPQKQAKKKYGPDAAAPGCSSHGGTYNGRDAMAMDYGNWFWVYAGDKDAFYADCRAVGLTPGVIAREPWHVIDNDPWAALAAPASGSDSRPTGKGAKPLPLPDPEEVTMIGIYNKDDKNEETRRALVGELSFQPISAWYSRSQWPLFNVKNVTQEEWDATKALVNLRRTSAGMKQIG